MNCCFLARCVTTCAKARVVWRNVGWWPSFAHLLRHCQSREISHIVVETTAMLRPLWGSVSSLSRRAVVPGKLGIFSAVHRFTMWVSASHWHQAVPAPTHASNPAWWLLCSIPPPLPFSTNKSAVLLVKLNTRFVFISFLHWWWDLLCDLMHHPLECTRVSQAKV